MTRTNEEVAVMIMRHAGFTPHPIEFARQAFATSWLRESAHPYPVPHPDRITSAWLHIGNEDRAQGSLYVISGADDRIVIDRLDGIRRQGRLHGPGFDPAVRWMMSRTPAGYADSILVFHGVRRGHREEVGPAHREWMEMHYPLATGPSIREQLGAAAKWVQGGAATALRPLAAFRRRTRALEPAE